MVQAEMNAVARIGLACLCLLLSGRAAAVDPAAAERPDLAATATIEVGRASSQGVFTAARTIRDRAIVGNFTREIARRERLPAATVYPWDSFVVVCFDAQGGLVAAFEISVLARSGPGLGKGAVLEPCAAKLIDGRVHLSLGAKRESPQAQIFVRVPDYRKLLDFGVMDWWW